MFTILLSPNNDHVSNGSLNITPYHVVQELMRNCLHIKVMYALAHSILLREQHPYKSSRVCISHGNSSPCFAVPCMCHRKSSLPALRHHCFFIGHCIFWVIIFGLVAICVRVACLCMLASAQGCDASVFQNWARAGRKDFHWTWCKGHLWVQTYGASHSKKGGQKETYFGLCCWIQVSAVVWKIALLLLTDGATVLAFAVTPSGWETSWRDRSRSARDAALSGILSKRVCIHIVCFCFVRPPIPVVCTVAHSARPQLSSCIANAFPGLCAACRLVVRWLIVTGAYSNRICWGFWGDSGGEFGVKGFEKH